MDGKIAEESLKRREENRILKTEMCARIHEGLKREESARRMTQNDLATMKEEIKIDSVG